MSDKKREDQVVVLGIDGGTFEVIEPLIEKGGLPNISRLLAEGVQGKLRSSIPMLSPSIWTTIITGKNPGKHGIYDFIQRDLGNDKVIYNTSSNRRSKPIWSMMSEYGKRVCITSLIMTYPPDEVNGYMISALFTPPRSMHGGVSYTFPAGLEEEIKEITRDFTKQMKIINKSKKKISPTLSKEIIKSINCQIKLYQYLSKKERFDFRLFYLSDLDIISHLAWRYMKKEDKISGNAIFQAYEAIDKYLGELLTEENSDIILISDHGFRELKRVVSLNKFLESIDLLKYKNISILAKFNKMVKKVNPLRNIGKIKLLREIEESLKAIDWQVTKTYHFGTTAGTVYINLKGREPDGIVDPTEYDALCTEITKSFKNIKDPQTGEKVVDHVSRKGDLFKGKYQKNGPDLYLTLRKGYGVRFARNEPLLKEIITDTRGWTADHEINGIFIARGPHFKKNLRIQGASVLDIAPTILYIMGLPIPKDMDGRVLTASIDHEFMANNPPSFREGDEPPEIGHKEEVPYSKKEEVRIAKSLKDLGYL